MPSANPTGRYKTTVPFSGELTNGTVVLLRASVMTSDTYYLLLSAIYESADKKWYFSSISSPFGCGDTIESIDQKDNSLIITASLSRTDTVQCYINRPQT